MINAKRKYFTLVEIMITIGILIILMSISWVAGNKVLKSVKTKQMRVDISMLVTAVEQYKDRWGDYPFTHGRTRPFNFANKLSSVSVYDKKYKGARPMFIDYTKQNMKVENNTIQDPYKIPYRYHYDNSTQTYTIYSVGFDGKDKDRNTRKDNITSDDL